MEESFLKIENIKIWARVGVLEKERQLGQLFSLKIFLWSDFNDCEKNDDLSMTIDYSVLIQAIKLHAIDFSCFTIEKYSKEILELIKERFTPNRIKIVLTKCNPPINGFDGEISIVRNYQKS